MAHFGKMILWMTPIAATALTVPAVGADLLTDAQLGRTLAGAIGTGNGNGNGNSGINNGNGNLGNNNGNGNAGSNNGNGNAGSGSGNGNATNNNGNRANGSATAPHFAPNAAWLNGLRQGGSFPAHVGHIPGAGFRIDPTGGFTLNGYHGFIPR